MPRWPRSAWRCRRSGSRSTSRRPICPRKARITICRSRSACSRRWARSTGETLAGYLAVGELSLDGRIAPSPGVLLAAIHASAQGLGLICPAAQGPEAAWAGELEVVAAPDLIALLNHLRGSAVLAPPQPGEADPPGCRPGPRAGEGPGDRQARARDRGGRRAQPADDRAAGRGQVAARRLPARHPAGADAVGGAGSFDDRLGRRRAEGRPAGPHPARSARRTTAPRCRRWSAAG